MKPGALASKFDIPVLDALLAENENAQSTKSLTNSQGRYLLTFGSLDAIRARLATQRREGIASEDSGLVPEVAEVTPSAAVGSVKPKR